MYTIKCDGNTIYSPMIDDLVVNDPKCKLEVNTVGEASFSMFATHPHYGSIKKLRSVFEILQDDEVIFRGRATNDTRDFDNIKVVDIEGVMAYFNDSVIRPFSFPEDWADDADYLEAAKSGNVVECFLKWVIEYHNYWVEDFQMFKLGNVTVSDPNNYITRASEDYMTTWEVLKTKLFDSSLGGYLCVRYEEDGNYIDYLEDFDQINAQKIVFGKNLLDISSESDASEFYTVVIPLGAKLNDTGSERLTIDGLPIDVAPGIVRDGVGLLNLNLSKEYGYICAPVSETTWDDVTVVENLVQKGLDYLTNIGSKLLNTITVKALDLHFSDEEIEAFRIYRYIDVKSSPHNLDERYRLTRLEIDIQNPQNTVITLGDTQLGMTDINAGTAQKTNEKFGALNGEINKVSADIEGSIQMKSTGGLGDKVKLMLTTGKSTQTVELDLSEVRKAFADDQTDVTISDGVVTFGAGTLNVNGAGFKLNEHGYVSSTDQNAEEGVEVLPDAYETFFDSLVPVRFKHNDDESGKYHVGYIAHDVRTALTAAGLETTDFAGFVDMGEDLGLGLSYENFIALLHMKIKKLEQQIAELTTTT